MTNDGYGRVLPHLRAWRLRRAYSQEELAGRAGIARSTLIRGETGEETVRYSNVRKLAAALDISVEELLGPPPPEPGR